MWPKIGNILLILNWTNKFNNFHCTKKIKVSKNFFYMLLILYFQLKFKKKHCTKVIKLIPSLKYT